MKFKPFAIALAAVIMAAFFMGCASHNAATEQDEKLYFSEQAVRPSPKWMTDLAAAKDAEQLIVVAGTEKTTAYVTMHEKDGDGR